ncbi:hypothetical protein FN846DRAFT_348880 [Sphaerosporella brunnea]|uniref:Uncharacterized protein n=1 Tax=Sphaerosporella brunnea TaxID=1250544 RepID=A0A5J5EHI7_9PEZI|nr:hypothetical protein FN846DRAFT_348590 [Sphaerosporella brunnea]KAA8895175.1 hypothetical protein FN846DRAFT_348880 [Sphaerosporella brunnea]
MGTTIPFTGDGDENITEFFRRFETYFRWTTFPQCPADAVGEAWRQQDLVMMMMECLGGRARAMSEQFPSATYGLLEAFKEKLEVEFPDTEQALTIDRRSAKALRWFTTFSIVDTTGQRGSPEVYIQRTLLYKSHLPESCDNNSFFSGLNDASMELSIRLGLADVEYTTDNVVAMFRRGTMSGKWIPPTYTRAEEIEDSRMLWIPMKETETMDTETETVAMDRSTAAQERMIEIDPGN